jgi:hypothetical protein
VPISAIHRERIETMLEGHKAALQDKTRALSPTKLNVHAKLLDLGSVPGILDLADEFTDSPDLYRRISNDGAEVLRSRGIQLPDGVVMTAHQGSRDGAPPVLRFQFPVQRLFMLVDYDAEVGVSTRLTTGNDDGMDL